MTSAPLITHKYRLELSKVLQSPNVSRAQHNANCSRFSFFSPSHCYQHAWSESVGDLHHCIMWFVFFPVTSTCNKRQSRQCAFKTNASFGAKLQLEHGVFRVLLFQQVCMFKYLALSHLLILFLISLFPCSVCTKRWSVCQAYGILCLPQCLPSTGMHIYLTTPFIQMQQSPWVVGSQNLLESTVTNRIGPALFPSFTLSLLGSNTTSTGYKQSFFFVHNIQHNVFFCCGQCIFPLLPRWWKMKNSTDLLHTATVKWSFLILARMSRPFLWPCHDHEPSGYSIFLVSVVSH